MVCAVLMKRKHEEQLTGFKSQGFGIKCKQSDREALEEYYYWCRRNKEPYIEVVARKKYALITVDIPSPSVVHPSRKTINDHDKLAKRFGFKGGGIKASWENVPLSSVKELCHELLHILRQAIADTFIVETSKIKLLKLNVAEQ
jgi:hypothetical protein